MHPTSSLPPIVLGCFRCVSIVLGCQRSVSNVLPRRSAGPRLFWDVSDMLRSPQGMPRGRRRRRRRRRPWAGQWTRFFFKDVPLLLLKAIISHCHEDALMANPSDNKCFVDSGWRRQGCIPGRFKSKIKGSVGQTILHWVRKAWQRI